jgi:putative sigma-54 modulation protein
MELQVVGKNIEITEALREYLGKKMDKLTRHLPNIDEAKVEIHEVKAKSPDQQVRVQVTIKNKGTLLRGEEKAANVDTAIDEVIETLQRRIDRYKEKFNKKGRSALRELRQQIAPEETIPDKKTVFMPELVRVKRFKVKSMMAAEAAEQMELLSHDFFLFVNSDSGELNLIYRRRDGNYGIIEPELA